MRITIRFVFFIMPAVITFNCSSHSLNIVNLNLFPQGDAVIEVRPFPEAKKRLVSRGFKWRGALVNLIDPENGLYTAFEKEDFVYLRRSLIQSLRESESFKAIHDIQNEDESVNGTRLYICFDKSGVKQTTFESFCFLNACAWTENSTDSVLSKKEIKTTGKSSWSASGAKNEAITKFIKEVAQLISFESK